MTATVLKGDVMEPEFQRWIAKRKVDIALQIIKAPLQVIQQYILKAS